MIIIIIIISNSFSSSIYKVFTLVVTEIKVITRLLSFPGLFSYSNQYQLFYGHEILNFSSTPVPTISFPGSTRKFL